MLGDDAGENHDGEPPLGDDADENHDGEPPLGDDACENHHDGEPPEVGLILFSSSQRRRQGCRDDGEVAERIFLTLRSSEFGGFYKKSTCIVT